MSRTFARIGETVGKHETDATMDMAKQDTTKTYFLTLSGSKISIVETGIVPETGGDNDVND